MPNLAVKVLRLRNLGWILPRWQLAMPVGHAGYLRIDDQRVEDWHRFSRTATLFGEDNGEVVAAVPPLHDVALVQMTASHWILSGIERVEKSTQVIDYAQTWYVEPVSLAEAKGGAG